MNSPRERALRLIIHAHIVELVFELVRHFVEVVPISHTVLPHSLFLALTLLLTAAAAAPDASSTLYRHPHLSQNDIPLRFVR